MVSRVNRGGTALPYAEKYGAIMLRFNHNLPPKVAFATAQDYLAYQISFPEGIEENAQ